MSKLENACCNFMFLVSSPGHFFPRVKHLVQGQDSNFESVHSWLQPVLHLCMHNITMM